MNNTVKLIVVVLLFACTSCVQKTYKKTVVFTLDVSEIKNVKKVGIRGNDKPLSWDYDTEMKEIKKDTLYQVTITGETGFKFTEVKFVVNDTFELQNEDNRRVIFSKKDTTFFKAKFNKR
ncbi:hypothetical protein [Flavobacterium dankookense]|uniref:Oxidoreductase n=1 Tax=Flavobacterium dankookense TaxID=706186 RepID=A0A4R6QE43_9FLAO|nr:hypothetical protein [Flavobacterium dankookense]TDP60173.1 hypothetical protein BC748_1152 [Flavobacterium dankookense]